MWHRSMWHRSMGHRSMWHLTSATLPHNLHKQPWQSSSIALLFGSPRGQGGVQVTKTTSRSAPMPHGIPIDAYMNKGPKSELVVLGRTRIGVLG